MMVAAVVVGTAGDGPKTWRQYAAPGVAYAHPCAIPAYHVLTRDEVESWIPLLDANETQAPIIFAMYEDFVVDHDARMDRVMPAYATASAEAGAVMQAHGTSSLEFTDAYEAAVRLMSRAMAAAEGAEIQYIDSLTPILAPEQLDRLALLRAMATRRKCRAFTTSSRWVNLELRPLVAELPAEVLSDEAARACRSIIDGYEVELTSELRQWSAAMLEAGRRMREGSREHARAAAQASSRPAWERPAKITARIRALQLRTVETILGALPDTVKTSWRCIARERIYPQLYPDASATHPVLAALVEDTALADATRAGVQSLLSGYMQRYDDLCARLERFCMDWDTEVELGVGRAVPQDLPRALEPLLEERRALSRDIMLRCRSVVGDEVMDRHLGIRKAP